MASLVAVLALPAVAGADDTFDFTRTLADQPDVGHPQEAAIEASGTLLVTDTADDTLSRFGPGSAYTILAGSGTGTSLVDPFGVSVGSTGNIDVADPGGYSVKRFNSGGTLLSQFAGTVDSSTASPKGIVRTGDTGLIVADSSNNRLLRYAGGPGDDLAAATAWTVLAGSLPGPPAHLAMLGTDRVVASFPAQHRLVLFDAATGAQLDATGTLGTGAGQFSAPEGLVQVGPDLFVADGGNDRIQVFPGMGPATARAFTAPHVLAVGGKSVADSGCLFSTALLTAPAPSFGLCNGAAGGIAATAGTVDLFTQVPAATPTPSPTATPTPAAAASPVPKPTAVPPTPVPLSVIQDRLLDDAAASVFIVDVRCGETRIQFGPSADETDNQVAPGFQTAQTATPGTRCTRFRQPEMRGIGGGALAALLLAAGGAVANAIISARSVPGDFEFGVSSSTFLPPPRRLSASASKAKRVKLVPGRVTKVLFKPSRAFRRSVTRSLRRHKRVTRTMRVKVVLRGKTTTYKEKLVFRR